MTTPFEFNAQAIGLTGRFDRPNPEYIPTFGSVALSPFGGEDTAAVQGFRFRDILSVERVFSRVRGEYDERGQVWWTALEILVEGINLLGRVEAERISVRVSATQAPEGEPSFQLQDATIAGLRMEGRPARAIRVDPGLYSGTQEAVRARFRSLFKKAEYQQFDRPIQAVPLFETIELESPGVTVRGNEFWISGLGGIRLGELRIAAGQRWITMLRVNFDVPEQAGREAARGEVAVASGTVGGVFVPGVDREFALPAPRRTDRDRPRAEEDRRLAAQVAGKLLEAGTDSPAQYAEEELHIYLADVQQSVERFQSHLRVVRELDARFPCLWASGMDFPIPVSLGLAPSLTALVSDRNSREIFHAYVEGVLPERLRSVMRGAEVARVSAGDAARFFRAGLEDFLRVRFSARESDTSERAPYPVTVSMDTRGLRIYVSNTYSFEDDVEFAYPSWPKTGYLRAGRYIFGGAEPRLGAIPKFDRTKFDIPDKTEVYVPI